jgi:hypothetical protein
MIYYYSLFTLFAIVAIMIVIDPNVGAYITLLTRILKLNVERMFWMIRFHPVILSSPIARWWMMRKYMRTAEELSQQLSKGEDKVL